LPYSFSAATTAIVPGFTAAGAGPHALTRTIALTPTIAGASR
jgi:hypothetical protein